MQKECKPTALFVLLSYNSVPASNYLIVQLQKLSFLGEVYLSNGPFPIKTIDFNSISTCQELLYA